MELLENPAARRLRDDSVFVFSHRAQIPEAEKLRLVLLFALRHEREGRSNVEQLLQALGGDSRRNKARDSRCLDRQSLTRRRKS